MQQRFDVPKARTQNAENRKNSEVMSDPNQPDAESVSGGVARLPGIATQLIGERLRTMYASIVREPVPEEFLRLVRELDSKEGSE